MAYTDLLLVNKPLIHWRTESGLQVALRIPSYYFHLRKIKSYTLIMNVL